MERNKQHNTLLKLCATAMMIAIVFVGNYLRVKIPVPLGGIAIVVAPILGVALMKALRRAHLDQMLA